MLISETSNLKLAVLPLSCHPLSEPSPSTRKKKRRWLKRALALLVLIAFYSGWQMWDINRFGHADDGSNADCAIVLGAAAWHNKPSPVFKSRIDHAIDLYETRRVKAIILTGGYGKGADYAESEVAKKHCISSGVPAVDIFIETHSKGTEQNITEAKKIMSKQGFKTALIVSDPWHLKRACDMASHYSIEAEPSATTQSLYITKKSKLKFIWREFKDLHVWRFL